MNNEDAPEISKEEFIAMRNEQQTPLLASILARSKETSTVTIKNINGDVLEIEIRVMLTKAEVEAQGKFFKMMKDLKSVDDEYYYYLSGDFLSLITIDPELDKAFWRRSDIDPYIMQEIIKAFIANYE